MGTRMPAHPRYPIAQILELRMALKSPASPLYLVLYSSWLRVHGIDPATGAFSAYALTRQRATRDDDHCRFLVDHRCPLDNNNPLPVEECWRCGGRITASEPRVWDDQAGHYYDLRCSADLGLTPDLVSCPYCKTTGRTLGIPFPAPHAPRQRTRRGRRRHAA
jgi:hypothetical protein